MIHLPRLICTCICYLSAVALATSAEFTFSATDNCHVGNVGKEVDYNAGNKATRGKIKGPEEFVMVNFDLSKIKGMTVKKAKLQFHDAGAILYKVGFSSVVTPWKAGNANRFGVNDQGATWKTPRIGKYWAWPGSNLGHVINEMCGSRSSYGQVRKQGGVYELNVDPDVIETVASGHHHGFVISEHDGWRRMPWVGQTLRKVNGKEHNPWIFLKEQNGKAPKLIIEAVKEDDTAPGKVSVKNIWRDSLLVGDVLLEVIATGDDNNKGTALYYDISVDGETVPAWMLNAPLTSGKKQLIRLSEQTPGKKVNISICAVDEAGNKGPVANCNATVCAELTIPDVQARYSAGDGKPLSNKSIAVWAYPDLQHVNPITGNRLEDNSYELKKTGNYRNGNNIWNGKTHTAELSAWRDEWVAFQIAVENTSGAPLKDIKVAWSGSNDLQVDLYREWYVRVKSKNNFYPDPLLPLNKLNNSIHIPDTHNSIEGQTVQSIYVDILVNKDAAAKLHKGSINITAPGQKALTLNVAVDVQNNNMPRKIGYTVEFNHYSGWQSNFKDAQVNDKTANKKFIDCNNAITALAHQNRCTFNGVPYTHRKSMRRPVPAISGSGTQAKVTDWSHFDACYEGIFSGSIVKNNHRSEQPITHQTLSFYERWPADFNKSNMFDHNLKTNPSLDPKFTKEFEDTVKAIGAEFTKHFKEKGWDKVQLQLFLNNKSQYRRKNDGCYWLLDEPRYHNGYLALDTLGVLMRDAFKDKGSIPVVFRADVSRPQYSETILDDSLDLNVVGGLSEHEHIARRNSDRFDGGEFFKEPQIIWSYGGVAALGTSLNSYANVRIMDHFKGSNGHLPWLNTMSKNAWREQPGDRSGQNYAIFYNGEYEKLPIKNEIVFPSMRLKAYRRGQQDAEMLGVVEQTKKISRDQIRHALRKFASFEGKTVRTFREDAGTIEIKVDTPRLEGTREVLRALAGGKAPFKTKQEAKAIDTNVGKIGSVSFTLSPAEKEAKAAAEKAAKESEARLAKMMGEKPSWADACIEVHKKFKGKKLFVSTLGDSITYTGAFGTALSWQKHPDNLVFKWRNPLTEGLRGKGPKYGNFSGWTSGQLLKAVPGVIKNHKPEIAIILIGTNDMSKGQSVDQYKKNLQSIINKLKTSGCVPILTTLPPLRGKMDRVKTFNEAVHDLAKKESLPLIPYYEEIMKHSGGKWDGTFISKDGVHPNTAQPRGFYTMGSGKGGYELRNTLTAQTLFQVMQWVLKVK